MAEEFLGGTSDVTKVQFSERKKYIEQIQKMDVSFLDTIYDKRLYGFINTDYEVIAPISNPMLFGPYAGTALGQTHTVSIFNKFRDFYMNLLQKNTKLQVPDEIQGLKPSKSFVEFDNEYYNYSRSAALVFSQELRDSGVNTETTFLQFISTLNQIIFNSELKKYKLTKSGYALSEFSSLFHTGLYIDLGSNYDPQMDQLKVDLVLHPDFSCYAKHANMFGLNVDFNCPWRLVVDLDSKVVQENILNGRTTTNFFDLYNDLYTVKTGFDDLWSIKSFYELLYLQVMADLEVEEVQSNYSNLSTESWIKILLIHRFKELGLLHEANQSTTLLEDTLNRAITINRASGLGSQTGAIGFINSFCADTLRFIMEGA